MKWNFHNVVIYTHKHTACLVYAMKLRPSLMRSGPLQSRLFVRQQADNRLSIVTSLYYALK